MKRLCTVVGAVVVGCSAGFGFAAGAADAASHALIVGGKGEYAHLSDELISSAFGGYFAGYDQRVSVDFPGTNDFKQSVDIGATNLYDAVLALTDTTSPSYDSNYFITIGGVSEGAPSATAVLQQLQALRDNHNPAAGSTPPCTATRAKPCASAQVSSRSR